MNVYVMISLSWHCSGAKQETSRPLKVPSKRWKAMSQPSMHRYRVEWYATKTHDLCRYLK